MGPPRGGALLRMSTFRIRHLYLALSSQLSILSKGGVTENREPGTENFLLLIQFRAYFFQRRPARIFDFIHARALHFVQVLAALRTQTFAIFAAKGLQRQRQQQLLTQNVFEQQAFALVIADFRLGVS